MTISLYLRSKLTFESLKMAEPSPISFRDSQYFKRTSSLLIPKGGGTDIISNVAVHYRSGVGIGKSTGTQCPMVRMMGGCAVSLAKRDSKAYALHSFLNSVDPKRREKEPRHLNAQKQNFQRRSDLFAPISDDVWILFRLSFFPLSTMILVSRVLFA